MKKITLLIIVLICFLKLSAQTADIRITNYGNYSVGTPHFAVSNDSIYLTFDTNFPYVEFPVSGPAIPYTIGMVSSPPQSWGPVHAEVGIFNKHKSLAYIDWNSNLQKYFCYETHTEDKGLNWSYPQILDTISKGNSVPTNNLNPLIKNAGNNFYYLTQSFLTSHYGMVKITKASAPSFIPINTIYPLDTSLGIDLEPFDYEVAANGMSAKHALAFFKEGESKMYFVKSNDDGNNFTNPSVIWSLDTSIYSFSNPLNLDMNMDANGNIVIAFTIFMETMNFNSSEKLFMAISNDFGNTWNVDSVPGLGKWGVSHPMVGLRSNGHQVVTFLENGYIKTLSTDNLKSFGAVDTISDFSSANNFYSLMKNDFLYVAWEDNRFGFGMEEIYYDTVYTHPAPDPTKLVERNNFPNDVQICPNPFIHYTNVYLKGNLDELFNIQVIDMYGRILRNYNQVPVGKFYLERENLNSGSYIVKIINKQKQVTNLRIIISN